MVRTPPFHGVNGGSIPSRATKLYIMLKFNEITDIRDINADDDIFLYQTLKVHDDAGDVYAAEITKDVFRLYTTNDGQHIDFTHDLLLDIINQVEKTQFLV